MQPIRLALTAASVLVALSTSIPVLQAQSTRTYTANIPFSFSAADHPMPAGAYRIVPLSEHTLQLSTSRGRTVGRYVVYPTSDPNTAPTGQLRFNKLGDHYFLREFSAPGEGPGFHPAIKFMVTSAERRAAKELAARTRYQVTGTQMVALNLVPPHR